MNTTKKPKMEKTVSLADNESLSTVCYNGLVSMMDLVRVEKRSDQVEAFTIGDTRSSNMDFMSSILNGVYTPGITRWYLRGEVQTDIDDLVDEGCVYVEPEKGELFRWISVKKKNVLSDKNFILNSLYRKQVVACYDCLMITVSKNAIHEKSIPQNKMYIRSSFAVLKNGKTRPIINKELIRNGVSHMKSMSHQSAVAEHYGPGAVNLLNDRRYLWNVRVSEPLGLNEAKAKLDFGVDHEWVKSLLFAREAPMTETGRKRPIVHWVEQHNRRIASGTDVQISKHLRGVTKIEMDNLQFEITSPSETNN